MSFTAISAKERDIAKAKEAEARSSTTTLQTAAPGAVPSVMSSTPRNIINCDSDGDTGFGEDMFDALEARLKVDPTFGDEEEPTATPPDLEEDSAITIVVKNRLLQVMRDNVVNKRADANEANATFIKITNNVRNSLNLSLKMFEGPVTVKGLVRCVHGTVFRPEDVSATYEATVFDSIRQDIGKTIAESLQELFDHPLGKIDDEADRHLGLSQTTHLTEILRGMKRAAEQVEKAGGARFRYKTHRAPTKTKGGVKWTLEEGLKFNEWRWQNGYSMDVARSWPSIEQHKDFLLGKYNSLKKLREAINGADIEDEAEENSSRSVGQAEQAPTDSEMPESVAAIYPLQPQDGISAAQARKRKLGKTGGGIELATKRMKGGSLADGIIEQEMKGGEQ